MTDPKPDDRNIYSYRDAAGKDRRGDPAELLRRLTTCCGGDPNLLFAKAAYPHFDKDGNPVVPEGFDETTSLQANDRLAHAVCKAFKLGVPWDDEAGRGVPERVWTGVLDDFLEFLQGEESGADGTPICAPPSAPECSTCRTTGNSDCGSVETAPLPSTPPPSPVA